MDIRRSIGLIGTYGTFLFMGVMGALIGVHSIMHTKDPNYIILVEGTGLIVWTIMAARYEIRDKKGPQSYLYECC